MGAAELLGGAAQTFGAEEVAIRERQRLSAVGITGYQWRPDGARVLIPLSGDLHEFDLASRQTRRLTETPAAEFDPHYSPDGTRVAFVRDGELHVLDVESGAERQLTTGATPTLQHGVAEFIAQEELGRSRGFWWSPDGRRIAYTETDESAVPVFPLVDYRHPYGDLMLQRYPRPGDPNATVRLLIVDADGGGRRTMTIPSGPDWYLARVAWHPDGRQLAVQVQPRDQDSLQLLLVDSGSGAARTLLTETHAGWVELHDDLTWLADGGFLWSSARSGFRHLYRYNAEGALLYPVTAGAWPIVELSAVDEAGGWVYFTGHADGPFERHVYRARLDGSTARGGASPAGPPAAGDSLVALSGPVTRPERVTKNPGWHDPDFGPDYLRFLDTWSRATQPPSLAVLDADGGDRIAWIEENAMPSFAAAGYAEPEFRWVRPIGADGEVRADSLPAVLYRPRDFDPDRTYPVVVYTYGGPGAQVAADFWHTRGRGLWHQLLVQQGFLVWMCDGRGSGARGRAWVQPIHRRLGFLETEDQAACARALWQVESAADSTRTGIWGWSFGGYVAANAIARDGEVWAAAAAVAPVTDWRDYDTAYTERYMELPSQNPDGYRDTAPVELAARMTRPFLLAHGLSDDNVHWLHSVRLIDALVAAGRPPELHVVPGRGHAVGGGAARLALFRALTDFFVQHLEPEPGAR
ncbi:MAG: S9 family peptidase [Gemmatimonadota bacterium]